MSYVGFDPLALLTLRRATDIAVETLSRLQCDDPAAEAAMSSIARSVAVLRNDIRASIDRIVRSQALDGTVVTLDGASSFVRDHRGWTIGFDAAAAGSAMTVLDALQFATVLRTANLDELGAAELAAINRQLAMVATRAELVEAFLGEFSEDDLNATLIGLGTVFVHAANSNLMFADPQRRDAVGHTLAIVGGLLFGHHRRGAAADPTAFFDQLPAYVGALMVGGLNLDAVRLATVAGELIDRDAQGEFAYSTAGAFDSPHAADIVFAAMLKVHGAPTAFVNQRLAAGATLFELGQDGELLATVLSTASSPKVMRPHDAVAFLYGYVAFAQEHQREPQLWREQPVALGALGVDLFMPWMLQFTHAGNNSWPLSRASGSTLLAEALQIDGALARLGSIDVASEQILEAVMASSRNPQVRVVQAVSIGALIWSLVTFRVIAEREEAAKARDNVLSILAFTIGMIPMSPAATVTISLGAELAQRAALPDLDELDDADLWKLDFEVAAVGRVMLANAATELLVTRNIDVGPIPALAIGDRATSDQFVFDVICWLRTLDLPEEIKYELQTAADGPINAKNRMLSTLELTT